MRSVQSIVVLALIGIFCLLTICGKAQNCLNSAGESVAWWIVLKVPPTIGNSGYGYYDSNTKTGQFAFINKTIDLDVSPLTQTLGLINKDKLERVAWNDEKPNNQTSSTVAHAKGLIAYNKATGKGFYIVHSIPKYPAFLADHTINMTIAKGEQVYGQHLACFSMSLYELNNIAYDLQGIHPFIYEAVVTAGSVNQYLNDLARGVVTTLKDQFKYYDLKPTNYSLKAIFKTNSVNGSIFEDGLVQWLKSGKLTAQTWGRPLEAPWCATAYQVNNVQQITLTQSIKWTEAQDHSKWAITETKYSCFGDMNRMTSQWKRGGAFYCLDDISLHTAMKKIITASDSCSKEEGSKIFKFLNLKTE